MKKILKTVAVVGAILLAGSFVSCKGNKKDGAAESENSVRKIIAGTGGAHAPFEYRNDKNELVGFEPDLVREVFSRLPQYEVEFAIAEAQSTLTGLDAGLYQISFNQWGFNKSRGTKYIFSDVEGVIPHGIAVRKDNTEIKSVFDLPGHKVYTIPGNANDNIYRTWNANHPDKKILVSYVESLPHSLLDVDNGTIDFYYHSKPALIAERDTYGLQDDIKIIDVSLDDNREFSQGIEGSFFYFPIGEEQLRDDFNKAFEAALADGSVKKIFDKYFEGYDFLDSPEYIEKIRGYIAEALADVKK